MKRRLQPVLVVLVVLLAATVARAGSWPRDLHAYRGSTPQLDGLISPGEYDDAVSFTAADWTPQFNPVTDPCDLSLRGWVKHDGANLYFAFRIVDDVLYGIDTDRWLPAENEHAHELTRRGFPWFGDGVELLINASNTWSLGDGQNNWGNGSAWQMVCNLTKSRLGGIGVGGLLEGEERSNIHTWNTYAAWIHDGAMQAVAEPLVGGRGFVIEWLVKPNPCLEISPGQYWSPQRGVTRMGLNIGVQDADQPERGRGNFGDFNHEDWFAGEPDKRTWVKQWGTLIIHPGPRPHEIHVSPTGNDQAAGTAAAPLATLARARQVVRQRVAAGLDQDLLVLLHGGVYELDETWRLTPDEAGTTEHGVTYAAYPGHHWPAEEVTISGGTTVGGWQRVEGDLWTADLPAVARGDWWFRDLYIDGQRGRRARWPNDDYIKIDTIDKTLRELTFTQELPEFDVDGSGAELVNLQHWCSARGLIAAIDGKALTTRTGMGWVGTPWFCNAQPGNPCYLEHARALVDQPGEWYLDRATGKLYYLAPGGVNPNDQHIVAPRLTELLLIEGAAERPVRNVHFRGLDFAHANWTLPAEGYSGLQAAHRGTEYKTAPTFAVPLAVRLMRAQQCSFELCRVLHTGASGIGLGAACDDNRIIACEVADAGGNGIMVGWRYRADKPPRRWFENDWDDPADAPADNIVRSCYVHHIAQVQFGGVGIFDAFTKRTVLAQNTVCNLPYSGMSIGFRWSTEPSTHAACLVDRNHVFNVMGMLADGGAVYTLGYQPGTQLVANLIHDVFRTATAYGQAPNNGIFFDEGSKGFEVRRNLIFNTSGEPIRFNQCQADWHDWQDNFFGVGPTDVEFPWHDAAEAGVEPQYRRKVFGRAWPFRPAASPAP